MIACATCGHVNPFTTRFCRSCGTRLDLQVNVLSTALAASAKDKREQGLIAAGRSAVMLAGFLLVVAVVVRTVLVPSLPVPDLPPYHPASLIPAAPAAPGAAGGGRLAWRAQHVSAELSGLGVDLVHLEAQQHDLIAAQLTDGSFPGDDRIAATALAALAVQAYPLSDEARSAAAQARAYLQTALPSLSQHPGLAQVLVLDALLDAEELTPVQLNQGLAALCDGQVATWQAFGLASLPHDQRPSQLVLLAQAHDDPAWGLLVGLLTNQPAPQRLSGTDPFTTHAAALASGEARMIWALTAWQLPANPEVMISTLSAWSRAAPAPIDAATQAACGAQAAIEVQMLTLCACAHVAPLWFAP